MNQHHSHQSAHNGNGIVDARRRSAHNTGAASDFEVGSQPPFPGRTTRLTEIVRSLGDGACCVLMVVSFAAFAVMAALYFGQMPPIR